MNPVLHFEYGNGGTRNNATLVGSEYSGTQKYSSIIGAANGKLYCIPSQATQVLEVNPATGVTSLIGSVYSNLNDKWSGGILHSNGKIYCIPLNFGQVLVIDPANGSTSLMGTDYVTGSIPNTTGYAKWHGGALASNGKIYGIPRAHTRILEIDPVAGTTALVGSTLAAFGEKYSYGCFTNGKIYGMPNTLTNVLVYDIATGNTSTISTSLPSTSYKTGGCAVALNGKIFTAPNGQSKILVIDPVENSTSIIESGVSGYAAINLGKNGKVYCLPGGMAKVLEINVQNNYTKLIGKKTTTSIIIGSAIASNAKFYGAPYSATKVLEVELVDVDDILGIDRLVPSDLSTLASSNYNRYFNNK